MVAAVPPKAAREKSYRLELLLDAITGYAIYMLDPDGFISSWNVGAQRMQGYSAAEIIGQPFAHLFSPDDQAQGIPGQLLHQARTIGQCASEGWRTRKDGGRFFATNVIHRVHDEAGLLIGFAILTRDVTERIEAQQALSESESRFRLLVESVLDYGIYMLDPSGVVTNWNPGAARMKGYSADEIVGRHFSLFYTKEDRAAGMPLRVLETAAREGRYDAEGWRVRKDGSRFWASVVVDVIRNDKAEVIGFAKVTRDVTERRAAHEALRESERQFRLLVEGVTDYALYMLDPNGIITNWNAGAERIKGYRADEIIGQHFSRFHTDRDRAAGVPTRSLHIAAQEGRFEAEGWRVRKDGNLFWANVIIDPIKDETGTLIGFAKITRDITERRDAQIAVQAAQAQRDQAQRMEALGQLTGGVAHDFNNLLMIINGHLETLKRLVAEEPKGTRAAQAIEAAAKRGESLTRQLLTFSRRQTLTPVVVEVGERVEAFRAMIASSLGASATLVAELVPDLWPIRVDVSEFELALVNLTLNARDAVQKGGLITITAENVHLQRGSRPENFEGDFVAITVADTGCGIAADILAKVFDPFFTTKGMDKGSGLGLSQVHGFAHQSGGTVIIESELGRGTRVILYLPRAHAAPERETPDTATDTSGSGTVLVVEDNPDVAEVAVGMLQELGYEVEAVSDAEAALAILEDHKFNLVFSDIVMGGAMDGIGLARVLQQRQPELPVILVTGYSNAMASTEGEFTIIRKPYKLTELSRAVAIALAGAAGSSGTLVHLREARRGLGPKREGS